jgi:NAD(P)-dependent dehydrogenase (short-subunit alcohol dehydrogenase family)
LTRVVSRDLGKYGITVNAVAPAAATRLTATVPDKARQVRQERGLAVLPPSAPAATRMEADDVAPFVVYLASDAAANINGQAFVVMGGNISLLNYPAPARTITRQGRWTPEEIAAIFPRTLGMDLVNPAPPQAEPAK